MTGYLLPHATAAMPCTHTTALSVATHVATRYRIPGMSPDDVRQEASLVALQALPDHDPATCSLEAYVTMRVRARLSRLLRRALRRQAAQLAGDVAQRQEREPDRLTLAELTARLDYRQRWVIEKMVVGEKAAAIAGEMGCSVNAVRQMRQRAVEAMREAVT